MKAPVRYAAISFLIAAALLSAGCSEDKARAVQAAAENFAQEATAALGKIQDLMIADTSSPTEGTENEIARIIEDLSSSTPIKAAELSELLKAATLRNPSSSSVADTFSELELVYASFSEMFRSLPQGSYFAKDAVKKAETHAIKLTIQMINMADHIQGAPFTIRGRRIILQERINKAKQITDNDAKNAALRLLAEEVLRLRADENDANNNAIQHCLRAAEAGKAVTKLIRDYDSMKIRDILNITKETLGFVAEISNKNQRVEDLVKRYNGFRSTIENDPYWSALLNQK